VVNACGIGKLGAVLKIEEISGLKSSVLVFSEFMVRPFSLMYLLMKNRVISLHYDIRI
jgi:hypothetical protein